MTAPVADFIDVGRMRNRNIRLEVNQEEGLLRVADRQGRNVSDVIRRIINGLEPNLVEQGILCPTCFAVDCARHAIRATRAGKKKST